MSEKLFDALETCLQDLDNGETIDSALKRFPALATELRPILEASLQARGLAGEPVAEVIHRRSRAKVLQHAAEMREAKRSPRRRSWVFAMRPVAIALMLILFLFSGTGLVRASNGALPGDNLYPVKRTWEDVTLLFVSGAQRETLQLTYETERVEEINELLAEGRHEVVSFSGYVTAQTTSEWKVAGVPVLITVETTLPPVPVHVGDAVMVSGLTNNLGFLVAQNITSVAPGSVVPQIEAGEHDAQPEGGENRNGNGNESSSGGESSTEEKPSGSGNVPSNENSSSGEKQKLEGVLQSASGTTWTVNGQPVDVSGAEIGGLPSAGAQVTIEGYFNAQGVFIATKVVFSNSEGGSGSGGNSSDDNRNSNDNDGNKNDNSGGGGGGGGGGDDHSNHNLLIKTCQPAGLFYYLVPVFN